MVEGNPAAGIEAIAFAIVYGGIMRKYLRNTVRGARVERRFLRLRRFQHLAKHFATRGLIESRVGGEVPDSLQHPQRAKGGYIRSVDWLPERGGHERLGSKN